MLFAAAAGARGDSARFDRIVVPAQTSRSDGFRPADVAWLLERAPGEVVVLRPGAAAKRRSRRAAAIP
jgi:hypothetical protein